MSGADRFITFYRSLPQVCGYLPRRHAVNAVMDPAVRADRALYSRLVELGFRRSGPRIYRPACPDCSACMALRIPVAAFAPNRSQRRIWRRNAGLTVIDRDPGFLADHYGLYRRYLQARHPLGGMEEADPEDYLSFLLCEGIETRFFEFRDDGRCVAVAVVDVLVNGFSAVYTFYEPGLQRSSLGTHAVLWEIDAARRAGVEWLYLGYWIEECRKMSYKNQYRPFEIFTGGRWQPCGAVSPKGADRV